MKANRKNVELAAAVLSIGMLRAAAAMAGASSDFTAAAGGATFAGAAYDQLAQGLNEPSRRDITPPSSVLIGEACCTPTDEELDSLERHELLMAELEHFAGMVEQSSAAILQEARNAPRASGPSAADPTDVVTLALGW